MVRTTREGELLMKTYGVPDWVEEVHRRKFRWAGHVSRRHDNRWTRDVLTLSVAGFRTRGRPMTRWSDSIIQFFGDKSHIGNEFWMTLAEDREQWHLLEPEYLNFVR